LAAAGGSLRKAGKVCQASVVGAGGKPGGAGVVGGGVVVGGRVFWVVGVVFVFGGGGVWGGGGGGWGGKVGGSAACTGVYRKKLCTSETLVRWSEKGKRKLTPKKTGRTVRRHVL